MNSRSIYESVIQIRNLLDEHRSLIDYIHNLQERLASYEHLPRILSKIQPTAANISSWQDLKNQLHKHTDATVSEIRKLPPNKFAVSISDLAKRLSQIPLIAASPRLKELTETMLPELTDLQTAAYSDREPSAVFTLLVHCQNVSNSFVTMEALATELSQITTDFQKNDDEAFLEIYLNQEDRTINSLLLILYLLEHLYKLVHQIELGSAPTTGLEYSKIETGSKWFKLKGKKEIVFIIALLISQSGETIRTMATAPKQSKMDQHIKEMEAVSKYIDLIRKAEEAGMPPEEIEQLRQAYLGSLIQLASGTTDLEVNGEKIITENQVGGQIVGVKLQASAILQVDQ